MSGSPADAISQAIERSKQLLFPFNANKWFALGFTVFLSQCGEGGGTLQFPNLPTGSSGSGTGSGMSPWTELGNYFHEVRSWLQTNWELATLVGLTSVVVGLAVIVLVCWASSRAKLMFVESVITDRVEVGLQWSRAAVLGMSLLKFRLAWGFTGLALVLGVGAAALALGWSAFMAGTFLAPRAIVAYSVVGASWLLIGLPFALVSAILDDFVVPLMVLRNVRVRVAWSMCRREVLAGRAGGIALFYLLRVVLASVMAIVAALVACVTCCVAALPYLGSVALLPLHVFSRSFPLYYLEQLGIQVFPQPAPAWAAQDRWRSPS